MTSCGISFCDHMEKLLMEEYTLPVPAEYIYIGSYFCDRYFVNTPDYFWKECIKKVENVGGKVVLVIPLPGQNLLESVKRRVTYLISSGSISELVVNDPGMLKWCHNQFPGIELWVGRLMSKEIRDPRYDMGFQSSDNYEETARGTLYGTAVLGVETDPVHPLKQKPLPGCLLAVHTPYAFISASRYCELGSLSLDLVNKFRLDIPCNKECVNCGILYENMGIRFFKAGRAIFTENRHLKLEDMECDRIIFAADFNWRKDETTNSCQQ